MSADPSRVALPTVDPDTSALILFASGTTGKPKRAVLTHNSIVNNAFWIGSLRATGRRRLAQPASVVPRRQLGYRNARVHEPFRETSVGVWLRAGPHVGVGGVADTPSPDHARGAHNAQASKLRRLLAASLPRRPSLFPAAVQTPTNPPGRTPPNHQTAGPRRPRRPCQMSRRLRSTRLLLQLSATNTVAPTC